MLLSLCARRPELGWVIFPDLFCSSSGSYFLPSALINQKELELNKEMCGEKEEALRGASLSMFFNPKSIANVVEHRS